MSKWLTASLLLLLLGGCGGGGGSSSSAEAAPPTANPPDNSSAPDPDAGSSNPPPADTTIKILGLVSPGLDGLYADPTLRINHLINFSNRILRDSGLSLELQLTSLQTVGYPDDLGAEAALDDMTAGTHSAFADVANWRVDQGADLVMLLRPYANDGRCGIAWIGGYQTNGDMSDSAAFGFSVVAPNCSDYTMLHELGHNLGLAHSRAESADGGSLVYGRGHGEQDSFATLMASPSHFNAARLPYLSSPDLECEGSPCGIHFQNAASGADAVRALQVTMDQVAGYLP